MYLRSLTYINSKDDFAFSLYSSSTIYVLHYVFQLFISIVLPEQKIWTQKILEYFTLPFREVCSLVKGPLVSSGNLPKILVLTCMREEWKQSAIWITILTVGIFKQKLIKY